MKTIVTLGEILVEFLATEPGEDFLAPGSFLGPFPSGAPAIFIDQVARMGQPCGMIGCVGNDDFGRLNLERLRADGVDVSAIAVHECAVTGSAFVKYQRNGMRRFVFNIKQSASGFVSLTPAAEELLARSEHIHVMGSSLYSPALIAAADGAIAKVKARGGTVSFDPNIRPELLADAQARAAFELFLSRCDVLLPSETELLALAEPETEAEAIDRLLARGISNIVVKRGSRGASYCDANGTVHSSAFVVDEVDPTGAGDCFDATYLVAAQQGLGIEERLRYANAAGARAVTAKGPMEGVSTWAELRAFLAKAKSPEA